MSTALPHDPSAPPGLRIGASPGRGRGVFAAHPFAPGELLERAAAIVFPRGIVAPLRGTLLDDYWFAWDACSLAAVLGCGSLYNHACPANARFVVEPESRTVAFLAVRSIAAGDEVTVNYHGDPDDPPSVFVR